MSQGSPPLFFNHSETEIDMKKVAIATLVLATLLPAATVLAQQKMDDMKGMDMGKGMAKGMDMGKAATQTTHAGQGVVKKINAKAGVVTIAHEPVNSMNWPAMTMGFKVKDAMLLDKLAQGKKVRFEFVREGDDYVVTSLK